MDIRQHLKTAGIRQRELAQRIGVKDAALSKMLSGKQAVSAEAALRIAEALDLEPGVVLRAVAAPRVEVAQ